MYICNALKEHGYSTFSLSIIEYICITDLSLGEAKILILEREQFYLDLVFLDEDKPNSYNLLPIAGSSLGYKHTEQSLLKFSGENHHMFGKNKSPGGPPLHLFSFKTFFIIFKNKKNSGSRDPRQRVLKF